jgi:transcription initiation factor TFIIB
MHLTRGRGWPVLCGAALLLAARLATPDGALRDLDVVGAIPHQADKCAERLLARRVTHVYREWNRALRLGVPPVLPQRFVPRLCSELGLSSQVSGTALAIIRSHRIRGARSPVVVASAAIYVAMGNQPKARQLATQARIAKVAHISESSIRAVAREFQQEEARLGPRAINPYRVAPHRRTTGGGHGNGGDGDDAIDAPQDTAGRDTELDE